MSLDYQNDNLTNNSNLFIDIHGLNSTTQDQTQIPSDESNKSYDMNSLKWSWMTRSVENDISLYEIDRNTSNDIKPEVGDVALFRISRINFHRTIMNNYNNKIRIYSNDFFVGVFGNRYATDAYEGVVVGLEKLSLLTASGIIGTLKSKNYSQRGPTKVSFIGFLKNKKELNTKRLNLKNEKFEKKNTITNLKNLLFVVGSGMNSGKTTTCRKIINSLTKKGLRVLACKLTGSASPRDIGEMISAGAIDTIDFSDYGFPSTYKCERSELLDLFKTMTSDAQKINSDITIMEIADGILQRETNLLISNPLIQAAVKGVLVTADDAPAALYTTKRLRNYGYKVIAVSGAITSSPLAIREFKKHSKIPVISSTEKEPEMIIDELMKFI